MATIIGVESAGGVVLAADRRHVQNDVVANDQVDRIHDLGAALCAAVGDPGNVAAFTRTLDAKVDRYRDDHGREPTIDAVGELAGEVAASTGVEALVAGRTPSGSVELRTVDRDGGVLHDVAAARGTGAATALGALEAVDTTAPIDDVEDDLLDVVATVHERDPESGPDADVGTLAAT
ncbi:hypothetical protein G9C85_13810 [Halorubellus sp. JP-L1]|uniref:hypothetical protein n=1 Tax=Halorubellus sp. JP-L1 TaxID=2715753 RepID=UPI001407E8A7|nr:hypothetical protein [Halorubellus sp. JP-L1]NHN42697.1 hypothetical protein [Halorubellus sp. JP-L1]